jgi:F-type H+-transporting ATPase subunit a
MNWEIEQVIWTWGPCEVDLNLLFTWLVMALLVGGSWLLTRRLVIGPTISIRQCIVEGLVEVMAGQIRDVTQQAPRRYLPFIGSLFLFIALSNILTLIPGFLAPTSSVMTTSALAICVFFAVPIYGIADRGWRGYFSQYLRPTLFMLPFHVMGELSRTLALAVRLFGNMMSGAKIAAILLAIVPFLVPIPLTALSLLTGFIQAYIFAILAMVYIASATQAHDSPGTTASEGEPQYLSKETTENGSITDKGDPSHG